MIATTETKTYKILRFYFNDFPTQVIEHNLTLAEAQAHCRDPETSSRTAIGDEAVRRTQRCGPWFDGYEVEDGDDFTG